ncbi:MAG: hypothetical protein ACI9WC_001349 [Arenicella sp.]
MALAEIKKLIENETIGGAERQKLKSVKVLKARNISSLERAVSIHRNIILAVLDCNMPDTKGSISHDQLVKTKHLITGQHRSVDIVSEHLPETPITMAL